MGKRNWFVKPEVERLELSDGEWIEIKKRLTVAEERKLLTSGFKRGRSVRSENEGTDVDFEMDLSAFDLKKVETYLLDWSLKDDNDKPVAVSYEAICALDPEAFDEIKGAIDKHTAAMEQEKKATTGGTKLKAISR